MARVDLLYYSSSIMGMVGVKSCILKIFRQSSTLAASKPCINLSHKTAMVNEKVCIKVNGLEEGQKVTLQTYVKDGSKTFGSCGYYIADKYRNVNTFEDESHGGMFDGVEPMGLFWSIRSKPRAKPKRIIKKDLTTPFNIRIALHPGFIDFNELPWTDDFHSLASSNFYQSFIAPDVKCIPVKEDGLLGTLFLPPGDGTFPAVIDLFGMTDFYSGHRSSLLASNGIASFVIAYVGHEGLAKSYKDLDYLYFLKAFDWLSRHPCVNPDAMGGIGSCVGAAYVSLIAWKRPSMKCLVGISNPVLPVGLRQSVEGEVVEEWPMRIDTLEKVEGAIVSRPLLKMEHIGLALPYWRHGVKALYIQGTDDQSVNHEFVNATIERIPEEFKKNIHCITYPGAGHIIEPPYMPLCRMSYNSIFKSMFLWGGQPKPHAHAQIDSWPRIVAFLKENLMTS